METSPAPPPRAPSWLWVVVPMLVSALVFGAIAVAVRNSGEEDGDAVTGPAAQLPAVVAAAEDLMGAVPGEASIGPALGSAYGAVTAGFIDLKNDDLDDLAFAAAFDRLPDAEARLLGRSLGAIQAQLSPTEQDGARDGDDREGDIVFALEMARAAVETIHPDDSARDLALAVLPFSVQDLDGFDEIATTFAADDIAGLAPVIDDALSDAGAAELLSSIANEISSHLPTIGDTDYAKIFLDAYSTGTR